MKTSFKLRLVYFFEYFIILSGFFILNFASFASFFNIFPLGFLIVLSKTNKKLWILNMLYLISVVLSNLNSFNLIIFYLASAILFNIIYLVFNLSKKQMPSWTPPIFAFVCSLLILIFNMPEFNAITKFLAMFFNGVFTMCLGLSFSIFSGRRESVTLAKDELAFVLGSLLCFGAGLANMSFLGIWFGLAISIILIYTILRLNKLSISLLTIFGLSVGFFAGTGNYDTAMFFSLFAILYFVLLGLNRFIAIGLLCTFIFCLSLFFENLVSLHYIVFVIAFVGIIGVGFVKQQFLDFILTKFGFFVPARFNNYFLNTQKHQLKTKLYGAASVCHNLSKLFLGFETAPLTDEEAATSLADEIEYNLCEACENKVFCHRERAVNIKDEFAKTICKGLVKGKINLLDVSQAITTSCKRVNLFLTESNNLVSKYLEFRAMDQTSRLARTIGSTEVEGTSRLLLSLAHDIESEVKFLPRLEERLKQEILIKNTLINELIVCETQKEFSVIVYAEETCDFEIVKKTIETSLKNKMEIAQTGHGAFKEKFIKLVLAPKFSVVFGVDSVSKNFMNVCGDKHAATKLGAGKHLLALCDGIGTGAKASQTSYAAIGLLENFLKAGLTISEASTSLNRILSGFTNLGLNALDAVELDLNQGTADFIKLGAGISFIRTGENIEKIYGESLPLGVVADAKVKTVKKIVSNNAMIIMMTDGVVDSFVMEDALLDFIYEKKMNNPQTLASTIIKKALELSSNAPKDDMTVLCARIVNLV